MYKFISINTPTQPNIITNITYESVYESIRNSIIKYSFYILLCILMLCIIFISYIRLKHKFWSRQPVFHFYDIHYWLFPQDVILNKIVNINYKYYNNAIKKKTFSELTDNDTTNIVDFLKKNYLHMSDCQYSPTNKNVVPYFKGNNKESYFHILNENIPKYEYRKKKRYVIQKIIGLMSSRPLNYSFNNGKIKTVYYVDYLCCDKKRRKQNIAPQVIYTQAVDLLEKHNNQIFMFKREGEQSVFVPLTIYRCYAYDIKKWRNPVLMHSSITVVEISKNNYFLYKSFINSIRKKFNCYISADDGNILSLLETQNVFIYVLLDKSDIIGAYFFRDSCTFYNQERMIECFASICDSLDEKLFVLGFYHALKKITSTHKFTMLAIENIADNGLIIKHIEENYNNMFKVAMGYYLYNSAKYPFYSKECLIIN